MPISSGCLGIIFPTVEMAPGEQFVHVMKKRKSFYVILG
jgi:hypothetical protein